MEMTNTMFEDEIYQFDEFHLMLARNFAGNNADRHFDIVNALETGDIALAHRLAHNLKSNAGQLRKRKLQKVAGDIETNLENGKNLVTAQQLETLEKELKAAIEEFKIRISN